MNQAIYGFLGNVPADAMIAAASRLEHRGSSELLVAPTSDIRLVCRSRRSGGCESWSDEVPLVLAGYITNRAEIQRLLGRRSRGLNDRRLAWQLYCRFGTRAFDLLSGSFSIALADRTSRSLVLATDQWGVRPMYFARLHNGWMFASEYKAILAALDHAAQLDAATVGFVSATKYLPAQRTLVKDVLALAPAQYARLHLGASEIHAYSSLGSTPVVADSEAESALRVRESVRLAVHRLIRGCSCFGVALSGGLDSVLTLGAARECEPNATIHTYTVAFHEQDPVLSLAREAADHFRTEHHEIVIAPEQLPQLLCQLVWQMEDPVGREEMLVYLVLAQQAARDVPLVLYGHMADMLFAGMPRHLLIDLASRLPLGRNAIMQFYNFTQSGARPRSVLARCLVNAYFRGRQSFPPRSTAAAASLPGKRLSLQKNEPLNAALLSSLAQPSEIGAIERLHAWAGVELASIFHDRDVARQAFAIPGSMKIRGRRRKHILREAAVGILPPKFIERPKDLVRVRRDDRLRRVLQLVGDELLSAERVRARGLFEPQDVARLQRRFASGQGTSEDFHNLWTLMLIELWCRTFLEGGVRPYRFTHTDAGLRTNASPPRTSDPIAAGV